ncbi:MAG: class I mannose-6-phosphate isomerase [Bacteroidales bacterium]|nr:class I mannose-6-phosphate isomerase [Bacteroidales bacterium]
MIYPLKFKPIIKEKVWGGTKLNSILNKKVQTDNAGESWELSGVENNLSEVVNGPLKGKNIKELINIYKSDLVGKRVYSIFNNFFPLLIKFIDASDDLSVQVHPDDETAQKRHNENGKNEMWYIIDADKDADLILGVKENLSKSEYVEHVKKKSLRDILNHVKVKCKDVAYIPAGRIHAIMKGVFLAEIQQCSDLTYRIYDWDRKDLKGNYRQLHTEEAKDVVDLQKHNNYLINYDLKKNNSVNLCKNKYFTVNLIEFDKTITKNYHSTDSFVIYICISGKFSINSKKSELTAKKGDTILIPASISDVELFPDEKSEILEVYI